VLSEKPLSQEGAVENLDPLLLEELLTHIGSLAAIYHKPPSTFLNTKAKKVLIFWPSPFYFKKKKKKKNQHFVPESSVGQSNASNKPQTQPAQASLTSEPSDFFSLYSSIQQTFQ